MIKLTKDNFYYNPETDILEIDLTSDMNVIGEEFYTSVRKQILDNQEIAHRLKIKIESLESIDQMSRDSEDDSALYVLKEMLEED